VNRVEKWLEAYGPTLDALKQHHQRQVRDREERQLITEFKDHLAHHEVLDDFKNSLWASKGVGAEGTYRDRIEQLIREVEAHQALQSFSDVESEDSFANWALKQNRLFSRVEESVLAYFQTFSRYKKEAAKAGDRYLPGPAELFMHELRTEDETESVFSLNLGGVRECIPWVKQQVFDTLDKTKVRAYFKKVKESSISSLKEAEHELRAINQLMEALFNFPNWKKAVKIYNTPRTKQAEKFLLPDASSFEEHLQSYYDANGVRERYDSSYGEWNRAIDQRKTIENQIEIIDIRLEEITEYREKNALDALNKRVEAQHQHWMKHQKLIHDWLTSEGIPLSDYLEAGSQFSSVEPLSTEWYEEQRTRGERSVRLENAMQAIEKDLAQSRKKREQAEENYRQQLGKEPVPAHEDGHLSLDEEQVERESRLYIKAEQDYQTSYSVILGNYLAEAEKERYQQGYDFGTLVRAVLPETFHASAIVEKNVMHQIQRYLAEINEKNNVIAERKIRMLTEIFDQVRDVYDEYLTEINKVKNYFRGDAKRITGGFKVVISARPSSVFSIEWFRYFSRVIDEKLSGQLHSFEMLRDKYTLEDIMKAAYHQAGGTHPKPTIKDLLNPKSYFDLEFDMKTSGGQDNKGSTGQTYMAAALLGIARISVVEKDERKQQRKGVRFMPIDEAQGLGGNYATLLEIAKQEDYQIISFSTEIVGDLEDGEQYIYMLNQNTDADAMLNFTPFAVYKGGLAEANEIEQAFAASAPHEPAC
jgi:hypothetical protein